MGYFLQRSCFCNVVVADVYSTHLVFDRYDGCDCKGNKVFTYISARKVQKISFDRCQDNMKANIDRYRTS